MQIGRLVDDGVERTFAHRFEHRGAIEQVSANRFGSGLGKPLWVTAEPGDAVPGLKQLWHEVGADDSGSPGE